MKLDTNRRAALAFGIALPLLQAYRSACFGHMPATWLEWPIALDAYVTGALLLAGAWAASRRSGGRVLLGAGWGFACGILYRTFFEQLENPGRHAGAHAMVLVFKGTLLLVAVAGLVGAVRGGGPEARERAVGP